MSPGDGKDSIVSSALDVTRVPDPAAGLFPEEGKWETDDMNSDPGGLRLLWVA